MAASPRIPKSRAGCGVHHQVTVVLNLEIRAGVARGARAPQAAPEIVDDEVAVRLHDALPTARAGRHAIPQHDGALVEYEVAVALHLERESSVARQEALPSDKALRSRNDAAARGRRRGLR